MNRVFLFLILFLCSINLNNGFTESQAMNLEQKLEDNANLKINSVEFPKGLHWFNVKNPLQMKDLKGKVVLLDFWTYCCINCMHVIPELKHLEEKYPNELVVVGVHSAKFVNERDSDNIRQSILRYEIKHPVVNDPELNLWQQYGIHAWPTLVLINPEGYLVLNVSGEGHYETLDEAVSILIQRAESKSVLNRLPLEIVPEETREADTYLRFPGKIFAADNELIVSDSNHNRIVISDETGQILYVIGSGSIGNKNGNFEQTEFNHPQGIFKDGNLIYVADTENHLIREIDLSNKMVKTIAGTGERGEHINGKARALEAPLNSPWDLVKVNDTLYIAMAGAHQIWSLNLKIRELDLVAGSGREDIVDGKAKSSALAQPSGISFDGQDTIYFADSEVSAARSFNLKTREVRTLIGHGLFEFGDQDGSLGQAKLQHPLGIAFDNDIVYVADTYNSKVKMINLKNKKIETIAGSKKGFKDGTPGSFFEPGGISIRNGKLYIADTNNHAVRVLDLKSRELTTLPVTTPVDSQKTKPRKNPFLELIERPEETVKEDSKISFAVRLPKDHEFSKEAPFTYEILKQGKVFQKGTIKDPDKELPLNINLNQDDKGKSVIEIDLDFPYCSTAPPKLCKFKSIKLIQPISVESDGKPVLKLETQI